MKRIYLAGPDVFFREAPARFAALQARCAAHGLRGVRPSDGGMGEGCIGTGEQMAERIYRENVELLRSCDAVLANLMPFRNELEPDSGTVFEVGMAIALGKPVAGVVPELPLTHEAKVERHCGLHRDAQGVAWDGRYGFLVEAFGQPLNLMLSRSTKLCASEDEALKHLARELGVLT